ncbi:MAG: class I SAM-dependent methyltransferase [bacterium]
MINPPNISQKCNLCENDTFTIISQYNTRWIAQCKKCGLYFLYPVKNEQEELKTYTDEQLTHYNKEIFNAAQTRRNIYETEIKTIKNYTSPDAGLLLDIGCSTGFFLKLMHSHGWHNLSGIEISKNAAAVAEKQTNAKIYSKPLKECAFSENSFAVITLWDVIDHLLNPKQELRIMHQIIKKNGILVIRVRNMNFHMPLITHTKWFTDRLKIYPSIIHHYGFNPETLKILLENSGFTVIKIINSALSKPVLHHSIMSYVAFYCISGIKNIFYFIFQTICWFSKGKYLFSPSIIIYAQKK